MHVALWSRTNKNRDVSTGPLARPFARSLALLTPSLAPHYSLRSRAPLRSTAITCLLARSLRSLFYSRESGWLDGYLFCVFFCSGPQCKHQTPSATCQAASTKRHPPRIESSITKAELYASFFTPWGQNPLKSTTISLLRHLPSSIFPTPTTVFAVSPSSIFAILLSFFLCLHRQWLCLCFWPFFVPLPYFATFTQPNFLFVIFPPSHLTWMLPPLQAALLSPPSQQQHRYYFPFCSPREYLDIFRTETSNVFFNAFLSLPISKSLLQLLRNKANSW